MTQEHDEDYKQDDDLDYSGLVNKIKNYLTQHYDPVSDPRQAEFHYTTQEIFQKIYSLFPSDAYTADMIALWLHNAGFTFYDYGEMKLEWMMKKAVS